MRLVALVLLFCFGAGARCENTATPECPDATAGDVGPASPDTGALEDTAGAADADGEAPAHAGHLAPLNGCYYANPLLPGIIADAEAFYRTNFYGNFSLLYSCDFERDFVTTFADFETLPLETNAHYLQIQDLRARILEARDAEDVGTIEKFQLGYILSDVEFYLDLAPLEHYVDQFGDWNYDNAWLPDPVINAAETLETLVGDPERGWCGEVDWSTQPDYDTKILTWLTNLAPKIGRWQAALQHQVAVGKPHANITMEYEYFSSDGYVGYEGSLDTDYTRVCATLAPANQTQCTTAAEAVNAALADLKAYMDPTYLAACAAARPNSAPGLVHTPDGAAAYQALLKYHLGFEADPADIYSLGAERVQQNREDLLTTANAIEPYADFAAVVTAVGNTADPRYYFCGTSDDEVITYYAGLLNRIVSCVGVEFGYFPRSFPQIVITGSSSTYNAAGSYDYDRRFWRQAPVFNIGNIAEDPEPNGCAAVYDRYTALSTILHEGFPGHALQGPLQQEIDCALTTKGTAPTGFIEGWALYVEALGFLMDRENDPEYGLFNDPVDRLGFHTNTMLRNHRMQEDTALNADLTSLGVTPWSYDEAWQAMRDNGFTEGYAKSETARYVTMSGQATAYMVGRIKIEEIRADAEAALGPDFDPAEFHNVLTRWGGATLADMEALVQTYVAEKTTPLAPANDALFGIDLIRQQFAGTVPLCGLGR